MAVTWTSLLYSLWVQPMAVKEQATSWLGQMRSLWAAEAETSCRRSPH